MNGGVRMTSEARRKSILAAAIAIFGSRGYVGTTTDEVARAAGVSQTYVVRLFGTKEKLFLAAHEHVVERILEAFRDAVHGESTRGRSERMGTAYIELLADRGLHLTLHHAFLLGGDPVIGEAARKQFARVWRFLREEAELSVEEARDFLARGMLVNTLVGLRLIDDYGTDPAVTEVFRACFPADVRDIAERLPRVGDAW
ncbi:TetR/AcrR family transcriptional regulator [Plantactinospora sp. S1510]|uniref:TetR/AcrR family transcriptional regulator n=1 Tax=Plantactinospora alkalitolerans TaxID=2789879 RepID=A0ABS0H0B1_9ACTN|nr:TetR/AcrR family transcriptional regulator [Plantactinospora alkalitolerans]MBF9131899.1 TetR/AcrR family transcriptional regulator [Plantactinospora alkalitolerans]